MKLYVLERVEDYEPNVFVGAYSTKELARQGLRDTFLAVTKTILSGSREDKYDIESLEAFTECSYDEYDTEFIMVKVYHKGEFCDGSEYYEIREVELNDTDAGEVY